MIKTVRGKTPKIGPECYLAESSVIVGDVELGASCTVWFNATIRGDVMPIRIGRETNIQDNAVIHGTYNKCGTTIGDRVTVGHGVILHGCDIGDLCLIGMGAIVMDLAQIPSRSIVAAGSLVTEGARFPEKHLLLGRPAKAVRPLTEEELAFLEKSANNYLFYKTWYEDDEKARRS